MDVDAGIGLARKVIRVAEAQQEQVLGDTTRAAPKRTF